MTDNSASTVDKVNCIFTHMQWTQIYLKRYYLNSIKVPIKTIERCTRYSHLN